MPYWPGQGFGTGCCESDVTVRFGEDGKVDACQRGAFDRDSQVSQGRHPEHDQVARLIRPPEPPPCFQASVPNLNDLLGYRNIGSDEDIGVCDIWLGLRHGCSYTPSACLRGGGQMIGFEGEARRGELLRPVAVLVLEGDESADLLKHGRSHQAIEGRQERRLG